MPVLRSGTFILKDYPFQSASNCWASIGGGQYRWPTATGSAVPANNDPSVIACSGPATLDTTTEGTGLAAGAPPPGFTPTAAVMSAGIASISNQPMSSVTRIRMALQQSDFPPDDLPLLSPALPVPPFLLYLSLINGVTELTITGGFFGDVVWGPASNIVLQGNYDIVYWWWTIPDVSACGDAQESHHQLLPAGEDPGAPWVRLDPDDPDAAPTPVVTTVTPNHGLVAGGTAVEVIGSGFGDGCSVTFDGAAATSLVVDSQYRITCVAPAHAAGSATVVVTNADGVSS